MRQHLSGARTRSLIGALSLLALVACTSQQPELASASPDDYCRHHGAAPGSMAYEGCLAAAVAAQCAGDEPAAQARCERRLSAR